MELFKELISTLHTFDNIYVAGHKSPDADSIASSVALSEYLCSLGFESKAIYGGFKIDKLNLKLMVTKLGLRLFNIGEDFKIGHNDLLILVDCQMNQSNSITFGAKTVACIDHHVFADNFEEQDYYFNDISPSLGSCSTLIYSLIKENSPQYQFSKEVECALLLGLMLDTNNLTNGVAEDDFKMSRALNTEYNNRTVTSILRSSYTEEDLVTLSKVISKMIRVGNGLVSFIGDCDNNLLGQIADFMCEIEDTDYVILISDKGDVYRFSIRSYGSLSANSIAERFTQDLGSGGGHNNKSAGVIFKDKLAKLQMKTIESYSIEFMKSVTTKASYFVYGKDNVLDIIKGRTVKIATKTRYNVRCKKLSELLGSTEGICSLSTLEGIVEASLDQYLIIGVRGEPYYISKEVKEVSYKKHITSLPDEAREPIMGDLYVNSLGINLVYNGKIVIITKEMILDFEVFETLESKRVLSVELNEPIVVKGKYGVLSSATGGYLILDSKGEFYLCERDIFNSTYLEGPTVDAENIETFLGGVVT